MTEQAQPRFMYDMSPKEFLHHQKQLLIFGAMLAEVPLEAVLERLEAADDRTLIIPPSRYLEGPATEDRDRQLARLKLLVWATKRFKQHVLPAGNEQQDVPPEGYKVSEHETPHYHQQSITLVHGEDCLACGYERQLKLLAELRDFLSGVALQLEQTESRKSEASNVRAWVERINRSTDERRA